METNVVKLSELLTMTLFLGSIVFILGIVFQGVIVFLNKSQSKGTLKIIVLLLLTRICSVITALFIWRFWFFNFDVMLGPILLPVVISEVIFSPIFLEIFGYNILKIK
jgi:hypothetical protein